MSEPRRPGCPHCESRSVHRNGCFVLKNGERQQRFLCRSCGRTFHSLTGTPLNYLKKRHLLPLAADAMGRDLTVRRKAAELRVHVATAFRWRHRLLAFALQRHEQPTLSGRVVVGEAYVPYSEKGSRKTNGPGSHGCRTDRAFRRQPGRPPFRRFIDGKPSCVMLAAAADEHLVGIVGRGRPRLEDLEAFLKRALGAVSEFWGTSFGPYGEACQHLGVPCVDRRPCDGAGLPEYRTVNRMRTGLHAWLLQFRGVATRYLEHYVAWFHLVFRSGGAGVTRTLRRLLPSNRAQTIHSRAA